MLQVLVNLLTNAVQASESGTVVHLNAQLQESWKNGSAIVITVADSGPGIAAGALGSVFTPFFTTRKNGTGLGLSLARKIVEGHGGELDLESTPGSGTTARLVLPVRRPSFVAGVARQQGGDSPV
jgi:signal transduction histidine kinase